MSIKINYKTEHQQVTEFMDDLTRCINEHSEGFHTAEDIQLFALDLVQDCYDCVKYDRWTCTLILMAVAKAEISFN